MAAAARDFSIVLTTVDSREAAERIVARALDERLAACVQVCEIESHYMWDGERRRSPEFLLSLKIKTADYAQLADAIREVHPYDTPEILRVDVAEGDPRYLAWMRASTR